MAVPRISSSALRTGIRKIPATIAEYQRTDRVSTHVISILKQTETDVKALLTKMTSVRSAKTVLRASHDLQLSVLSGLKLENWEIRTVFCPLFHEDPDELTGQELSELKKSALLFFFRKELDARLFLKKAGAPKKEALKMETSAAAPPGRAGGNYLTVNMPCPIKLGFHARPQGDVFHYGRLFADHPIYILRRALDTERSMALDIGKDEYDGILEPISFGDRMTFYSEKTGPMAQMVLKGLIKVIMLGDIYECDTSGLVEKSRNSIKMI